MTEPITISDELMRQRVIEHIRVLNLERPWIVEVRRPKRKRSLSQNGLYWMWLGVISDETGNDPDVLHEFFKLKYLETIVDTVGNYGFTYRTTTKLEPDKMAAYLNAVEAFAASELGIMLPQPEDRQ